MKLITKVVIMMMMPVMIAGCKTTAPTAEQRQQQASDMNEYMTSHGHMITNQH